jgi:class 3 adenylate cyclase
MQSPLHSAAPASRATLFEALVGGALAAIAAPSLMLYRLGERVLPATEFKPTRDESLLRRVEEIVAARPRAHAARVLSTVLFTDIAESTRRVSEIGDARWRELLEAHDLSVRWQVAAHGGRVVKSLGDGYLAVFESPAHAIRCGRSLGDDAESLGVRVKVGIHTGECEAIGDDVAGMAVHIAARVVSKACPGEVLATSAVRDMLVGSGIAFTDRGAHELRGVPGVWSLLAVEHTATSVADHQEDAERQQRYA